MKLEIYWKSRKFGMKKKDLNGIINSVRKGDGYYLFDSVILLQFH